MSTDDVYTAWLAAQRSGDLAPDLAPAALAAVTAPRRRLPSLAWAAAALVLVLRVLGSFAYLIAF